MTRFLKLVRHEDGKWKALPTETDDLTEVSPKERAYAPIDPDQLLKALDTLLSRDGGIKSIEDVPRLASLMKKFSKKLVSRCVYCNVLQSTKPDILSEYLDKGGWETINIWLQYAKTSTSPSFLVEMLRLCQLLPMTLNRLKENNTAKLVKSLTKHENADVKSISSELVTKWMTIIKDKKAEPAVEKKKKEKKTKPAEDKVVSKASEKSDTPKSPVKLKGTKRPSSEKEIKKEEYEDVKIDPEPLTPIAKKPRPDRPKTAKIFQKKFRATGLEEETPLPKRIPKKTPTVDKTSAAAAAKNALKLNYPMPERVTERRLKPENLATINENTSTTKGIKLIPAKPRPTYVLHESASFMDALVSQPMVPIKRKKKVTTPPHKSASSPTSPTLSPPKLQFYKDTLEMNEEAAKKEESEKENVSSEKGEGSPKRDGSESTEPLVENEESMEVSLDDGSRTPPNVEADETSNPAADSEEIQEVERKPLDPNQLRSILSHGRRRGKKKSVKWVEDDNIKEIFFFEMDETERVNVLKTQNFGDLKSNELRQEREGVEMAKRQAGDKMEEMTRWWIAPIRLDLPPPLIELGCQSTEKENEKLRQQSTLQEIYFTKEMIPDSPHEPDLEIVPPQEPKVIPLDEENQIGALVDYSGYEIPLPDVLSHLIKVKSSLPLPLNNVLEQQVPMDTNAFNQLMVPDPMHQQNMAMQAAATPYDPAEPLPGMPPNSLLGVHPNLLNAFNMTSPPHASEPQPMMQQNEWRTMDMVRDQYFNRFPINNIHPNVMQPALQNMNMRPRIMKDNFRPGLKNGPPRGMGSRPPRMVRTVPCRHFMAGGCRFGLKCTFLHPGVNGPPPM